MKTISVYIDYDNSNEHNDWIVSLANILHEITPDSIYINNNKNKSITNAVNEIQKISHINDQITLNMYGFRASNTSAYQLIQQLQKVSDTNLYINFIAFDPMNDVNLKNCTNLNSFHIVSTNKLKFVKPTLPQNCRYNANLILSDNQNANLFTIIPVPRQNNLKLIDADNRTSAHHFKEVIKFMQQHGTQFDKESLAKRLQPKNSALTSFNIFTSGANNSYQFKQPKSRISFKA